MKQTKHSNSLKRDKIFYFRYCDRCGRKYQPTSSSIYCDECKEERKQERQIIRKEKRFQHELQKIHNK